jgi:hypothetical protein
VSRSGNKKKASALCTGICFTLLEWLCVEAGFNPGRSLVQIFLVNIMAVNGNDGPGLRRYLSHFYCCSGLLLKLNARLVSGPGDQFAELLRIDTHTLAYASFCVRPFFAGMIERMPYFARTCCFYLAQVSSVVHLSPPLLERLEIWLISKMPARRDGKLLGRVAALAVLDSNSEMRDSA